MPEHRASHGQIPPGARHQPAPATHRLLNIGETSARTGLSPKMIRYYEQQGLFEPHARSTAGYRQYDDQDLHSLNFIRSARELGFSLKQIAELTGLWRDRGRASAEVMRLALAHINELEDKAATLQRMAATLRELARHCHGDERPECPILDGIADQSSRDAACHSEANSR
jgi:Cu(I)-responsive transcriptional regulator